MANSNDVGTPLSLDDVFAALESERDYQVRRWGYRQPDGSLMEGPRSVEDYLVYMKHYLTKTFAEASEKPGIVPALEMLRKVVTLGVACFQQHGVPMRDPSAVVVNGRDGLPA